MSGEEGEVEIAVEGSEVVLFLARVPVWLEFGCFLLCPLSWLEEEVDGAGEDGEAEGEVEAEVEVEGEGETEGVEPESFLSCGWIPDRSRAFSNMFPPVARALI